MNERGREIWIKVATIGAVLLGTAALIWAGAFDDGDGQRVGAVQAWTWACGTAVAGAGMLVAGRSYLKAKRNGNGAK